MIPNRLTGGLFLVTLAALGLVGCGGGERTYAVKGKLVYDDDGQPIKELAGFTVTFTSEKLGKSSTGPIDEAGAFRLSSRSKDDGAFPGEYQVIVSQPHPDPERGENRRPVVELSYEDPTKSDLKAVVKPENNDFTFKLRRLKKGR